MALLLSESWTVSYPDYLRGLMRAGLVSRSDSDSAGILPDNMARHLSILFSLGVHALLLSILIFGRSGGGLTQFSSGNQPSLAVFDVAFPEAPAPFSIENDEGQGDGEKDVAPMPDPEIRQDPTYKQWSVKRIRRPSVAGTDRLDVVQRQGETNQGGSGSGDGFGQAFDPYAGASPQYREARTDLQEEAGRSDPRLDKVAVADYVRGLRQRLGFAAGRMILSLTVGRDGEIISAEVVGGNARVQLQLFVKSDIIGRRLYQPGPDDARYEFAIVF